ncbi:MAG: signal peptidase II [Acidimicrobiia bacterium]|nr:signal peptidase II [Acidimicrobiia bacterium]
MRGLLRQAVSPRLIALAVAAAVLVLDQLTKWWALSADLPTSLIGDFLVLRLVRNPGAAFNSLQGSGVLIGVLAIAIVLILVRVSGSAEHRRESMVFGLIMGGAAGNLVDRIFRGDGFLDGAVIDWIDLWFIPTFNVADASLTVGAVLAVAVAFLTNTET